MHALPDSKVSASQKASVAETTPRNDPAYGAVTICFDNGNGRVNIEQISKKSAADLCGQLLEVLAGTSSADEQRIQAAGLKLPFASGLEWPIIVGEAWDDVSSRFATPWKDLPHHDQTSIKRIMQAAGKKPAQPSDAADEKLTRLNVNLNQETADILKQMSQDTGLTITEVVRKAVGVYAHLLEESAAGRKIQTMDANGKNKREILID